jgi:hypothetical protein
VVLCEEGVELFLLSIRKVQVLSESLLIHWPTASIFAGLITFPPDWVVTLVSERVRELAGEDAPGTSPQRQKFDPSVGCEIH